MKRSRLFWLVTLLILIGLGSRSAEANCICHQTNNSNMSFDCNVELSLKRETNNEGEKSLLVVKITNNSEGNLVLQDNPEIVFFTLSEDSDRKDDRVANKKFLGTFSLKTVLSGRAITDDIVQIPSRSYIEFRVDPERIYWLELDTSILNRISEQKRIFLGRYKIAFSYAPCRGETIDLSSKRLSKVFESNTLSVEYGLNGLK